MSTVYCPFPDKEKAFDVSRALLDKKLIACANVLNEGESLYLWEGKMKSDKEVYVIFKTSTEATPTLVSELESLHPYEVPAIVVLETPCNLSYFNWVSEQIELAARSS
ncbi:divalent-cation tolerance protein CutA [bacterium]|nr:divalent-cation tolerance protein CutA [bacterium]